MNLPPQSQKPRYNLEDTARTAEMSRLIMAMKNPKTCDDCLMLYADKKENTMPVIQKPEH